MIRNWTPVAGKEPEELTDVCAGDLVTPRLEYVSGAATITAGVFPPHILYRPNADSDIRPGIQGGEITSTDPPSYMLAFAPFWAPMAGRILVGGGAGAVYNVRIERRRCAERPPHSPSMTLRVVRSGNPLQLPRGTFALKSAEALSVILLFAGEATTIALPAGQQIEIGERGQGTVEPVIGPIQALVCYLDF